MQEVRRVWPQLIMDLSETFVLEATVAAASKITTTPLSLFLEASLCNERLT